MVIISGVPIFRIFTVNHRFEKITVFIVVVVVVLLFYVDGKHLR